MVKGCRERSRGALSICGSRPVGVYSAGTAQKLTNCMGYQVGNRVVILSSGNIGLIIAHRTNYEGAKVEAVCEVTPYSGGLPHNITQCPEDFGIPLYLSTTVVQIHGDKRSEGITIAQSMKCSAPLRQPNATSPATRFFTVRGSFPRMN